MVGELRLARPLRLLNNLRMEILLIWVVFAVLVGVAANARGRSGTIWFIVAVVISPVLALIAVLVMRNIRYETLLHSNSGKGRKVSAPTYLNPTRTIDADAPPKARWGGKANRVTIDRTAKPFEPDGVYAGVPYRVAADGSIDAIMQGAMVRFRDFDKFTGSVGGQSTA